MPKPQVKTEAAASARETFLHNLIAVAVLGGAVGLLDVISGGGWSWSAAGAAAVSGALAAVVAYLRTGYLKPYLAIRKSTKEK